MSYKVENLVSFKEVVYSFTNTPAIVIGIINLKVSLGARKTRVNKMTQFVVVKLDFATTSYSGDQPSIDSKQLCPHTTSACDTSEGTGASPLSKDRK